MVGPVYGKEEDQKGAREWRDCLPTEDSTFEYLGPCFLNLFVEDVAPPKRLLYNSRCTGLNKHTSQMFTDNNLYGNSFYYCVCSVCSCVSKGQRQILGVFLSHSLPYLFRQGLPLNLGLADSDGLTGHRAPDPQVFLPAFLALRLQALQLCPVLWFGFGFGFCCCF